MCGRCTTDPVRVDGEVRKCECGSNMGWMRHTNHHETGNCDMPICKIAEKWLAGSK